jgi:hypothetical protein
LLSHYQHYSHRPYFCFLNRHREPYSWTDEVPEDDANFQGLLENEEEAVYLDISAELPGVVLETEEQDYALVSDEPETDFRELAEAALHNAGINANDRIRTARAAAARIAADGNRPAVVANENKIVYEITFDLLDARLPAPVPAPPLGDNRNDTITAPVIPDNRDIPVENSTRYPTRACRSVVGNQPYDQFAPRVFFLQLGQSRAHVKLMQAA